MKYTYTHSTIRATTYDGNVNVKTSTVCFGFHFIRTPLQSYACTLFNEHALTDEMEEREMQKTRQERTGKFIEMKTFNRRNQFWKIEKKNKQMKWFVFFFAVYRSYFGWEFIERYLF